MKGGGGGCWNIDIGGNGNVVGVAWGNGNVVGVVFLWGEMGNTHPFGRGNDIPTTYSALLQHLYKILAGSLLPVTPVICGWSVRQCAGRITFILHNTCTMGCIAHGH